MALEIQAWIERSDLKSRPDVLFAFGDNVQRWGLGGQAKSMRGEPNSIGIATLWAPGNFFSDAHAERQNAIIDGDMEPLFEALRQGQTVVFPADGVGTGLADLERRAPKTFAHLTARVAELKTLGGL